ncbi:MAG: 30S ribosomal protein S9 [Parcubacteria group bacterium]|nr:30S ribosomal protein S9 [Parcubacteria group bacterium]
MVIKKKSIKKTPVKTKKALVKKAPVKKDSVEEAKIEKRYYEAVGRRKKATARVRLFTCQPFENEKGKVLVNGKPYDDFFTTFELQEKVISPLKRMKSLNRFEATVKVKGGGILGQAEAIRHGLSRTLVKFNPDFSKKLKKAGFLRRDPRKKERKKPGLKKARKAPQWSKR